MARLRGPPPSSSANDSVSATTQTRGTKKERSRKPQRRILEEDEDDNSDEMNAPERTSDNEDEDGDEDDDDSDDSGDDEENVIEGSPKGKKRARVNSNGDGVKSERSAKRERQPVNLVRDVDGYVSGSIVRMRLHQFLTYDDVEFRPGPYLNMVIGPNGTGKSSIACAIVIGLSWPTQILGRARNPKDFVKQGYNDGYIEIELKGPKGDSNPVIRRCINTNDKKEISTYFLNGKPATKKSVKEKVKALNIQCGNLCSFLPQDKVAEFAKMNPQELLKATQEAAGHEKLLAWHQDLIKFGNEVRELSSNSVDDEKELNTAMQRNSVLERDVQRYKERREIERQIELLQLILPYKEYKDAKRFYETSKEARDELHRRVMALQEKNKPVQELKRLLDRQHKEASEERDQSKSDASMKFRQLREKWNENDNLEGEADEVVQKLSNLKEEEKARKERIKKFTKQIHEFEQRIAHPPEVEDLSALNEELKGLIETGHTLRGEKEQVESKIKAQIDESANQKAIIERNVDAIKKLQDMAERKLVELEKWDRDSADAVRWLRKNQDKFRMQVFEPPLLILNVPDWRFTDAVEGCFNSNQIRMFVCQCEEDYKLMHRLFSDTNEALGRKVAINTWFRPRNEPLPSPPMSDVELHELGFERYAIDCVECPDGIQDYLKRELQLHRVAIATIGNSVDVNVAMEAVSRVPEDGRGPGGATFIVGRTANTVRRSNYGRRLPQNMTRELRPARNFKSLPIDEENKRRLESEIAECRTAQTVVEEEIKKLEGEMRQVEDRWNNLQKQREDIEARKKAVNEANKQMESLKLRLARLQEMLQKEQNAPNVEKARQKLREASFRIAKKRATIIKDVQALMRSVTADNAKATRAGLRFLQAAANKIVLEELCRTRDREYDELRLKYEAANTVYTEAKEKATTLLKISKQMLLTIDPEIQSTFRERVNEINDDTQSADDIRTEIEEAKAKLELTTTVNANVIEQYEKREAEIERLRRKIEDKSARKEDLERRIGVIKGKWLPRLERLVATIGEKFSEAFDSVGCAGEVRLSQHEDDYNQWAIDILVKFRDKEKLQLLTGQRQSGGERALTTVMYLMSLNALARTPFSLVDEINQGMDARYERAVHNRLVRVTCTADSGQYFLITPKLLSNLEYHERMKILCISNGEWLPDDKKERDGNLMKMIERYVGRTVTAA